MLFLPVLYLLLLRKIDYICFFWTTNSNKQNQQLNVNFSDYLLITIIYLAFFPIYTTISNCFLFVVC